MIRIVGCMARQLSLSKEIFMQQIVLRHVIFVQYLLNKLLGIKKKNI